MLARMNMNPWPIMIEDFWKDVDKSISPNPKTNIIDQNGQYLIEVEVPGFSKTDIKISIDEGCLLLSGKRSFSRTKNDKFIRSEFGLESFSRRIPIPTDIDENRVSANMNNGILSIILAKSTGSISKSIEIE